MVYIKSLLFLLVPHFLFAQYTTISNGNWSDPNTWNIGTPPPTWGNYTVTINHAIVMDVSPQGAAWQLLVNSGASLQASSCQSLNAWGNAIWLNHGTISCYTMSTPGRVENYGVLEVDLVGSGYSNSVWINHYGGVWTSQEVRIVNHSVLKNYGEINILGNSTSCHSPSSPQFLFAADSLLNHGAITSGDLELSANTTYFYNADSASIASNGYLDITDGTTMLNRGSISAQGDIYISESSTATIVTNYGPISTNSDLFNYSGVEFYNYGCDCYVDEKGDVIINGSFTNHGLLENHGRVRSSGSIHNYGNIGTTDCGYIGSDGGSGALNNYNSATLFGPLVACVTLNAAPSSTVAPSVIFSCPPLASCFEQTVLLDLIRFDVTKRSAREVNLSWIVNQEEKGTQYFIERSTDGVSWSTLSSRQYKNKQQKYTYIDAAPLAPLSYYRLKTIHPDNISLYSEIKAIEVPYLNVSIYPNPSDSYLTLTSEEELPAPILYNSYGQQVDVPIKKETNNFYIDIRNLPSGLYLLKTIWSKDLIQKL
ncbi:T9SS type A sorting domain-containing protein [Aureispira anguillae]|uniref:T9SS type A sorting domain-containing protein n=1 Tax=Aureispira anguillae TaxID=2864201 RepID=A0A915YCW0_9BACT|nr:T9SS type A sorting domain-containing protein [Aureispira anguillae]BDS10754.1 T9SS type A sorting domain-containing protein [Aureispira anguillae]